METPSSKSAVSLLQRLLQRPGKCGAGAVTTSEVQRLHALVQAGAGNAGQVVAKGFGAGQVPVYVALGLAGHLGGVVGKFHSLRACAAVRSILRWANLSHLKFAARMQRLPNRLPALDGLRALRSGMLRAWATARAECVRLPPFMESKNSVRAWGSCGRSFGGAAPAPGRAAGVWESWHHGLSCGLRGALHNSLSQLHSSVVIALVLPLQ